MIFAFCGCFGWGGVGVREGFGVVFGCYGILNTCNEINQGLYGGICTEMYYAKAITYICNKIDQPSFFVFSNEIDWVKNNVDIPNPTYIDFNNGADSWQDMFLMSQCKHNIIANSSFSWWGAWLNSGQEKLVIAPKKWFNNHEINDIVCESWIKIDSQGEI